MESAQIIIGFQSAIDYWRGVRAPDAIVTTSFGSGTHHRFHATNDRHPFVAERRALVTRALNELHLPAPLDLVTADTRYRQATPNVRTHHWHGPLPSSQLTTIAPGISVCSPELAISQLANQLQPVELMKLMYEFCGTYVLNTSVSDPHSPAISVYSAMCTPENLEVVARSCRALQVRGSARMLDALRRVISGSASPMETNLALLMSLPRSAGGFGFPKPLLNAEVELSAEACLIFGLSSVKPDFYWPEAGVIAEYQSTLCHPRASRTEIIEASANSLFKDSKHQDALVAMGLMPFQITKQQAYDLSRITHLLEPIGKKLGVRLQSPNKRMLDARRRLHAELFPPSASRT